MFFGEVPEAVILADYKDPKHLARVRGDIAENKVYHALNDYFKRTGDDVLIVHSHKFLINHEQHEKDFIVFNLSKGKSNTMLTNSCVAHLSTFSEFVPPTHLI